MIVNPPKQIDLLGLQNQLSASGIIVNGLHVFTDQQGRATEVNTYDTQGNLIDLPPGASTVIASYTYTPTQSQSAVQTLLSDLTYDLKSRQAFAIILGIQPGTPGYPTV